LYSQIVIEDEKIGWNDYILYFALFLFPLKIGRIRNLIKTYGTSSMIYRNKKMAMKKTGSTLRFW